MTSDTTHHDHGDEDRRADLYCRNCGDPFGPEAEAAAVRMPSGSWRPCPNPSPGRPLVDCGVGGHMYTETTPTVGKRALVARAHHLLEEARALGVDVIPLNPIFEIGGMREPWEL